MTSNTSPQVPPAQRHDRIVTYPRLKLEWGVSYSRVHLGRLEKAGKFPKRVPLGGSTVAWLESELAAWLAERAASRTAVTA